VAEKAAPEFGVLSDVDAVRIPGCTIEQALETEVVVGEKRVAGARVDVATDAILSMVARPVPAERFWLLQTRARVSF